MEKLHIQPSELDMLPFYEYEYTIEIYKDMMKEKKDAEDEAYSTERDKYNISGIQNQASKGLKGYSKMPKMPSIKMPKI